MAHETRVVLFGAACVGKTALVLRFTNDYFPEVYDPSIEDSYRKQAMVDSHAYLVSVLDTAGQEEYAILCKQMLVYKHV